MWFCTNLFQVCCKWCKPLYILCHFQTLKILWNPPNITLIRCWGCSGSRCFLLGKKFEKPSSTVCASLAFKRKRIIWGLHSCKHPQKLFSNTLLTYISPNPIGWMTCSENSRLLGCLSHWDLGLLLGYVRVAEKLCKRENPSDGKQQVGERNCKVLLNIQSPKK